MNDYSGKGVLSQNLGWSALGGSLLSLGCVKERTGWGQVETQCGGIVWVARVFAGFQMKGTPFIRTLEGS